MNQKRSELRHETRLPYTDPRYVAPKPAEVAEVVRLLELSGSQAGGMVGVDGRSIRRWIGGDREIPYSAWRLFLIEAGLDLPASTPAVRKIAERG